MSESRTVNKVLSFEYKEFLFDSRTLDIEITVNSETNEAYVVRLNNTTLPEPILLEDYLS